MKFLIAMLFIVGCGTETSEDYQEISEKYADFDLRVQVKPADRYGYFLVHVQSNNDKYPEIGEGIHKDKREAVAWALRDMADEIEKSIDHQDQYSDR